MKNKSSLLTPQAKKLRTWLDQMVKSTDKLSGEIICQPATIWRLIPKQYERIDTEDSPVCQLEKAIEWIVLEHFIKAVQMGGRALTKAQGLYLCWNIYLDPAPANNTLPTLPDAIRFCCKVNNLIEFIEKKVVPFIRSWQDINDRQRQQYLNLFEKEQTISLLMAIVGASHRRTLHNYVSITLNTLAVYFQRSVPGIFDEFQDDTSQYSSDDTSFRPLTQQFIEREYAYLPSTFGRSNPASTFIERSVQARSLRGDVIPNQIITAISDFPCVSGVLVGEAGSGRSSYMQQIVINTVGESISTSGTVLAFNIHAPEFYKYARNRKSVYDLIVTIPSPKK